MERLMFGRGKVVDLNIAKAITFNEDVYTRARIEIDHVNHGLNLKTKPADVCQFLLEIDGMDITPGKVDGEFNYFALEVLCPVKGIHFGKKFQALLEQSLSIE